MSMELLYIFAVLLGFVGGIGIVDEEVNKVTSGISIFGVIALCLYAINYQWWNIIFIIIISLFAKYLSFSFFYRFKK